MISGFWKKTLLLVWVLGMFPFQMAQTAQKFPVIRPFLEDGKYGFIDRGGRVIVAPRYKFAWDSEEGMARVGEDFSKYGFIDSTGKLVVPAIYRWAGTFHEGLAWLETTKQEQNQFVDRTGKIALTVPYEKAWSFYGGRAVVKKGNHYGFMNRKSELVIEAMFDGGWALTSEVCAAKIKGKWRLLDGRGRFLGSETYDDIDDIDDENLIRVHQGELCGYVDVKGRSVIPLKYGSCGAFSSGLAPVSLPSQWGYYDADGKLITPARAVPKDDGRAWVWVSATKAGFINRKGDFVQAMKFDNARSFSDGLAAVQVQGKWGFIDATGKMVIEPRFDEVGSGEKDRWGTYIEDFREGFAPVLVGDRWGFIDKTGRFIHEPTK